MVGQPGRLATEIEFRFGERLLRLAKKRLDHRLASRIDEQDVFQSVMRSFFGRHARGHFAFETWDDVWSLLAVMTRRKCVKQAEVHFARCRDVRRDAGVGNAVEARFDRVSALFHGSVPGDEVLIAEASERLLAELSEREQDVFALAFAGRTTEQIAAELGRTQRTVRRLLCRVRERLEQMATESS